MTVDDLKRMFNVVEDQELAPIFGRKKGAVSAWRKSGVPAAIEVKARDILATRQVLTDKTTPAPPATGTRQKQQRFIEASLPILEDDQVEMIFDQVRGMVGK